MKNVGMPFVKETFVITKEKPMKDFSKAEKVAVKYLLEWGRRGEIDFPDAVVTSYFNLLSGDAHVQREAVRVLCSHIEGVIDKDKLKQVEKEMLSCID
ncbi:hypothetical protein E9993_11395 [Labilibacter sediminis]|nr:hypothetical protein E9993_11395 [Labilibacter sediminis]